MKYVTASITGDTARLTVSNESLQVGSVASGPNAKPQRIGVSVSSTTGKVTLAIRPSVIAVERKRELANRASISGFSATEFSTGDI